ncbi:MAG TPA: PKD domain-containing protein, partial [Thermoplasmata archaeon]|nr:PKD domain-containing protein [Thermoplasmata archaeon]
MARGLAWGILATLVVGSALGAALFLPPAPAQAPMKIWEAYARGYATITQVDMTWEENGNIYTAPVGFTVAIKPEAGGNVVIDEPAMLMSPSPAQFNVDPNDPTTQDGALTPATIPNGSSLTFSYAEKWLQGYLPAPPWWCMEHAQYTHTGVQIALGGEVLPFAIQDIIANPYFDSESSNSQIDVWNYMLMHPTIVIGKTPLWKEIPNTAGEIVSVAISATNIAVKDDNDGIDGNVDATGAIVRDIIPQGWTVVPGSFSINPTSTTDNPDGSKTVIWVVDIPAADITGHDPSKPTPYYGMKFRYQLQSPQLPAGRIDLPRADVDTDHDETIDAQSAIPVLDVFSVNNAPTAALSSPVTGVEGTPITFDASASSDVDGDALQYRWDYQSDGTWDTGFNASAISPPVTFGDDATGTVTVEVSDGDLTGIATASY